MVKRIITRMQMAEKKEWKKEWNTEKEWLEWNENIR